MNSGAELSGNLEFLSLADLLQLLGGNGSTGILRLKSEYTPDIGVIYVSDGNPVDALLGNQKGPDALYALFGWLNGQFEFKQENVTRDKAITQSRMEIILDGLRMLDDGEIDKLGPSAGGGAADAAAGISKDGIPVIKGPLVDYMYVVDEEIYEGEQDLVVEGKHGDWIWVILEGSVDVYRNTPKGQVKVISLGDGAFIGSAESFLMKGTVRSATVRSAGTVQLGILDSQRLAIEFTRLSHDMRDLVISLDRRLKQVTDNLVAIRMQKSNIREYIRGRAPVLKQGQGEERLFMITRGDACVVRRSGQGDIPLAMLKKGDIFGNFTFLNLGHEPGNAWVYGSDDLKVTRLDVDALQADFHKQSQTFKNIVESCSTCIAATTQIVSSAYKRLNKK